MFGNVDFGSLALDDPTAWTATTAAELWRAVIEQGGRASTDSFDAQAAFERVHEIDATGAGLTARLLLSYRRWHRVTGELVRAVERSGLLDSAELDLMALELLEGPVWHVPVTGSQLALLGMSVTDGAGRSVRLSPNETVELERPVEPPLRRWAARRAVEQGLLSSAEIFSAVHDVPARHGAFMVAGLLDAVDSLDPQLIDPLVAVGLAWPSKTVRDRAARVQASRTATVPTVEPPTTLW